MLLKKFCENDGQNLKIIFTCNNGLVLFNNNLWSGSIGNDVDLAFLDDEDF